MRTVSLKKRSAEENISLKPAEKLRWEIYSTFDEINGSHPWKEAVPGACVEYSARILRDSKIAFFNFPLAKEMGLIPPNHPERFNAKLEKKIIETFALQIINEYDIEKNIQYPEKDIKKNKYMATRYLQLQHSCKVGSTSGDGRSIWNGFFRGKDSWDISSCGTGATCLSPHFAETKKAVRTGDPKVCYGSGLADVDEGLTAAIMSEVLHEKGIFTERTLVIVETAKGNAINVRAAKNLIRPSHLFLHLKQENIEKTKASLDYFISRQIQNNEWEYRKSSPEKYDDFLQDICLRYARFAAQLEDEYIFCWLDWDGDNMLTAGGIIDYGSIRQMGLFHHRYRYDDVDRYSTNIKEQKNKARYLVQTFVQLVDFVKSGKKKDIKQFKNSSVLKLFDEELEYQKSKLLLRRIGFSQTQQEKLLNQKSKLLESLFSAYRYFESKESTGGYKDVPDGINWPAAYAVKNLTHELPRRLLEKQTTLMPEDFLRIIKSPYTGKKLLKAHGERSKMARQYQKIYLKIINELAANQSNKKILLEVLMRASYVNTGNTITGDAIIHIVNALISKRKKISNQDFVQLVQTFINKHKKEKTPNKKLPKYCNQLLDDLINKVEHYRYTI